MHRLYISHFRRLIENMNRLFPGATFVEINSSPKTKLMNDEKYENNSITIKNIINHSLKTKTYCAWEESGRSELKFLNL